MEERDFEIGLFELTLNEVVSIKMPPDALLYQIVDVGGAAYAVFVKRSLTDEERASLAGG